jgi:hypothetical protein
MVRKLDSDFDEDAAIEALWESLAAPHPRDILKQEHNRQLKGYPRNVALEKWDPEIEEMILGELERTRRPEKTGTNVLRLIKRQENKIPE